MVKAQRTAILDAWGNNTIGSLASTHPEIICMPVKNLHERVISGKQDQPIGHNFFVNAAGFLLYERPYAIQFDNLIRRRTGYSIDIIASSNKIDKDRLLVAITENPDPELRTTLAVYLAGRSLEGENHLNQEYGAVLNQAKNLVHKTTKELARTTGLSTDMLQRATKQVQRTTFGSFDHLVGMVTSDNRGASGDYMPGTLRIEVLYRGNARNASQPTPEEAKHSIVHEINHAASAQLRDGEVLRRCGLWWLDNQGVNAGLEVDEGMTEYLAQLSLGGPGIKRQPNGYMYISPDTPYRGPVLTMLALHEQFKGRRSTHFATLFNAYHGDVPNQAELTQALETFYELDAQVCRNGS